MVNKIETKILNTLLDLYERSKTFTGDNVNEQNFRVVTSKLFSKYDDDSEYALYKEINSNLLLLKTKGFIDYKSERSGKIKTFSLVKTAISDIYIYLNRQSKADINNQLIEIWQEYDSLNESDYKPLLDYIAEQKLHLKENKKIQYFEGDIQEYTDVLSACKAILINQEEIFIRELSVQLFNNSKRLETLESTIRALLYKYGEYDEKDTVFEEHNIIKTPTYVMVKGKGILNCGQLIDLSKIEGDIGLSTQTLKGLKSIELNGASVITIENLTNFHKYQSQNELVIYLGGFHNSIKRKLIQLISKCNPGCVFKHYGDIDAGGFYILEHLKAKTGINFIPYKMDINILEENKKNWIHLTDNDKHRLKQISEKSLCYSDVIDFMLANNCKLEQEAEI